MNILRKLKISLLLISILTFVGGLWHNQYIYDSYHWGFIFSNALELMNGKEPYSEIFLEYGFLTVYINALTLKIFDSNIYSLIGLTCFIYALSLYYIGNIIYKLTENYIYSIFLVLIIFLLYPWPTTPWPNFFSFFFTILFFYYCLGNKNIHYIFSGAFLALAYLCTTTVYNLVLIFFSILLIIFIKRIKNKRKIKKIIISFLFFLGIFFVYLFLNKKLNIWLDYQTIPFLVESAFTKEGNNTYQLLYRYFYFVTIYPIKNFILEPQWSIYVIFFYSNIIIIISYIFNFLKKESIKYFDEILVINIFIFSLNIYAQVLGIEKLATTLALGSISFALLLSYIKSNENKFIIIFSIFFITIYSLVFNFNLENSKISGLRTVHLKDLKERDIKIKKKNIIYFSSQLWNEENWTVIDKITNIQKNISHKCKTQYGLNLTTNTYFHSIISAEKKQLIPWYEKKIEPIIELIDPNWKKNIQNEIDKNNIFIISKDNNIKLFNLKSYEEPIKINDYSTKNEVNKKVIYIYFPKNCY